MLTLRAPRSHLSAAGLALPPSPMTRPRPPSRPRPPRPRPPRRPERAQADQGWADLPQAARHPLPRPRPPQRGGQGEGPPHRIRCVAGAVGQGARPLWLSPAACRKGGAGCGCAAASSTRCFIWGAAVANMSLQRELAERTSPRCCYVQHRMQGCSRERPIAPVFRCRL